MNNLKYNLFLDDIRNVKMIYDDLTDEDFIIVRNYNDFVSYISQNGLPDFISFDNDLGTDKYGELLKDGYACAKWLVYESGLDLTKLKYNVHSANPVASVQIDSLLKNYLTFLKKKDN